MSNLSDLDLNLETLFQPAWAQGKTEANKFDHFTGNEGNRPERRGGDRGERRGPRRDGGGGGGERRGGDNRGPRAGGGKFGGPRKEFRRDDRRDERRDERREQEPQTPLPELNVAFIPEEKGVEQLARQIKVTGRAYPLFQIALLILDKADRYSVQLTAKKKDGAVVQNVFVCALDDTPWTSEEEVLQHVLKNHFATFYQAERIQTEPPKGVYTFVAQCGMSGVILGPPNYHDYQNQLRKLHAEKFSRMPFDTFKARVKIVKDEAVVKKWIEEQSFKTEYNALNVAEPSKLATMDEVEKHFRTTHKDTVVKVVETFTVGGVASRKLVCNGLQRLIRREWDQQRHFPLPIATKLSQQFANHGLQFFKVNKTVTHVGVARPLFLDIESSPVSDGIKRIVNFINENPRCTRKKLIEALAPAPKATEAAKVETPAAPAEGEAPAQTATTAPAEPKANEPTPEQTLVLVDLHWLIHAGAVLEFADGRMETAKKPVPKPEKKGSDKSAAKAEENLAEVAAPVESAADISAEVSPAAAIEPAPSDSATNE